jgi:hypothetical protein
VSDHSTKRPSTHADLSDYQRRGQTLFSWNVALAEHPEVEQHIVKAKLEARKLGFEFDYNEIRVPLTHDELEKNLRAAQQKFDNGLDYYADILAGKKTYADMEWSHKNAAEYYAEREGITKPSEVQALSFTAKD